MTKLLKEIRSPKDLKGLTINQLNRLADEIRQELVRIVTKTGGHLSSNLGVVELTLGLHTVFESPKDKIIWDVGHQSYVHKMITGRYDQMETIRQSGGLSGFTKRVESEHDLFDVGHSSTSISAALGFAVARDIKGENGHVIAVIGDGALTAGMAYEALNNGAQLKSNFIVILNDNQMSIDKNVGGIAKYLDRIRTGNVYRGIKSDVHKLFDRIPGIGPILTKAVKEIKDAFKQLFIPGMFFEEMGYTYLGPIDGHKMDEVLTVLNQAKKVEGPVLIHMITTKGKGHAAAEDNPCKYHGIHPAHKEAKAKNPSYGEILSEELSYLKEQGSKLVAISAAMPSGTGLADFACRYPDCFFDVGIAEQHAVTFAAGLALEGIKPYVAIYSSFLQRAYDQVLHDVCIQKAPVVFVLDRAGIVGEDGETHQGVFDLSYLSHIPNMTIAAPRDAHAFKDLIRFANSFSEGPLAIRYPKGPAPDLSYPIEGLRVGKSQVLLEGSKVAIIAVGSMVEVALETAKMLPAQPSVIDPIFIKPLDETMLEEAFKSHQLIVVVEENASLGGYGSMVNQYANRHGLGDRLLTIGIKDEFITHGSRGELLDRIGLTPEHLLAAILDKVDSHGFK